MKKIVGEMSSSEREIHIEHSIRNIRRSLVLIKRAVNALSFASKSLKGVGNDLMMSDINISKQSLNDAMMRLSDLYKEEEDDDD